MYDDEEEIKKKRRKLIIAIAVVVILIILLLIFIFARSGGNKKPTNKELSCELEVVPNTPEKDGVYTATTEIRFKNITAVSPDIQITKSTIGTSDNARNKETYTISKKGTFKIYGYVQDAAGNKGTCSLEVKVNPSKPTCELAVKSGTVGENGWYKSMVIVEMKSMNSNSTDSKITKFYITKKVTDLDTGATVNQTIPNENISEYTVKDNAINEIEGHVIDSNGNEGTCTITIKKDATEPTCKLKVVDGSPNSSGIYTGNAVVGFETTNDVTTQIVSKGVGVSKNYKDQTYAVTGYGTKTVYGYVKDEAGNEGSCSIAIKRPSNTTTPPPSSNPPKVSSPSCTLKVVSGTTTGGKYVGKTVVGFDIRTSTNNATIVSYGIGTSPTTNGATTFEMTTAGTYNVIGKVVDSYGNTSTCSMSLQVVMEDNSLAKKVKVGDMVAYDAGTWSSTAAVPTTHGKFGGYTSGKSKNASVTCRNGDSTAGSGWKVLSVSGNQVNIVHVGIPECYYYSSFESNANIVSALDQRAASYKNTYAASARMLKENDISSLAQDNALRKINAYYYLATASGSNEMKFVTTSGRLTQGGANAQGVRPVITLKADVKTSGKSNGAWVLTFNASKDSQMELPATSGEIGELMEFVQNVLDNSKES